LFFPTNSFLFAVIYDALRAKIIYDNTDSNRCSLNRCTIQMITFIRYKFDNNL